MTPCLTDLFTCRGFGPLGRGSLQCGQVTTGHAHLPHLLIQLLLLLLEEELLLLMLLLYEHVVLLVVEILLLILGKLRLRILLLLSHQRNILVKHHPWSRSCLRG